jgi:cyclic pyranopterin phosphate synthase
MAGNQQSNRSPGNRTRRPRKVPEKPELTHLDPLTGEVQMVDVGDKKPTERRARAEGELRLSSEALTAVLEGTSAKGNVLAAARIAGILAAKRTAELIPLCHSIALTHVEIDITPDPEASLLRVQASTRTEDRTGAEMEALTAVSVALLTLYDMLKAVDRGMTMSSICLMEKAGGRSGRWRRPEHPSK